MLVLTNYYSKWIVAEACATIKDNDIRNAVWKNVICQFRIPKEIMTNNGSQFISNIFKEFCESWGISLNLSTPRYA